MYKSQTWNLWVIKFFPAGKYNLNKAQIVSFNIWIWIWISRHWVTSELEYILRIAICPFWALKATYGHNEIEPMQNILMQWLYCMQLLTLDAKHVKNGEKNVNPKLYFHVLSLLQSICVCIYYNFFRKQIVRNRVVTLKSKFDLSVFKN